MSESDATTVELRVEPKGGSPAPLGKLNRKEHLPYTLKSGEETRLWVRAKELACTLDDGVRQVTAGETRRRGTPPATATRSASGPGYRREYLALKDE